jgi:hypothetical protein
MASASASASANANVTNHYLAMRKNLEKKFQEQLANPDNLKVADKTYGNMMQTYETVMTTHNPIAIGETPTQGSDEFLTMFPPAKKARITKGGKRKSKSRSKGRSKTKTKTKAKKTHTK